MPRVTRKTKNRGGKTGQYRCDRCSEAIGPGDQYFEWSFRHGGTHRQHVSHGHPRGSQLTQSKMAEVYTAQEGLQDWAPVEKAEYEANIPGGGKLPDSDYLEGIKQDAEMQLEDARGIAEGIAQEYQDAIDAMPASEEQNQERIDAIEEWMDILDQAVSELQDVEIEEEAEEPEAALDDAVELVKTIVGDAANEFSY